MKHGVLWMKYTGLLIGSEGSRHVKAAFGFPYG